MSILSLSVVIKPLIALFVLTMVRYMAIKIKRHIPAKWHAALYTPFTQIALEARQKDLDRQREADLRQSG